jgi:hypothetical protein
MARPIEGVYIRFWKPKPQADGIITFSAANVYYDRRPTSNELLEVRVKFFFVRPEDLWE